MTGLLDLGVIFSAVITALLTTLSVEYFAKPWLEARKERILEEHRRRRELQGRLIDLAGHAGALSKMETVWHLAPDLARATVADFEDAAAEVRGLVPVLHNWRVPKEVIRHTSRGVGGLQASLMRLHALSLDPESDRRQAVRSVLDAYEGLLPAADYIILKGRLHRQPIVSRIRTRRAVLQAIREDAPGAR